MRDITYSKDDDSQGDQKSKEIRERMSRTDFDRAVSLSLRERKVPYRRLDEIGVLPSRMIAALEMQ